MKFTNELVLALAKRQKGWRGNQEERERLSWEFLGAVDGLEKIFKRVSCICYRNSFIHHDELVGIVLKDEKNEGVVSYGRIQILLRLPVNLKKGTRMKQYHYLILEILKVRWFLRLRWKRHKSSPLEERRARLMTCVIILASLNSREMRFSRNWYT